MPVEIITRTKCDRCPTTTETPGGFTGVPDGWETIKFPFYEKGEVYFFLCPACLEKLTAFLNELKPKEPRRPRKDKGTKREKTYYPPLGDIPIDIEKQFLPENNPVDDSDHGTVSFQLGEVSPIEKEDVSKFTFKSTNTGKDIFSTFEMKTPASKGEPYIFRMDGIQINSKTMRKGVLDLLNSCFITDMDSDVRAVLSGYPDSPQLRQIKDILFPKNV